MTTSSAPLRLFRSLLREAKQVNDYNFRSYAVRRVKSGFRLNQTLQRGDIESTLDQGFSQLALLKRQRTLGNMFPTARSVME
mmetsp:Transcript_13491/g.13691  ORF Transcript_13491/g.13691 Transcript_13491/m.13691 type:complete len:82 (-) Transcript_13491:311-556(-)